MRNVALFIVITLLCTAARSQRQPPVMRYKGVAENIYLLERCGALTAERRAWLENVRGHTLLATGWSPAEAAAHDRVLKQEFDQRYTTVAKERCDQLARTTDHERATIVKVP